MKIGILTYHRSHNYGALLQAIALREILTRIGNSVTYIDYWPAYHRHMYKVFSYHMLMDKSSFLARCRYAKNCILHYRVRMERIANFENFIAEFITPYLSPMDEFYDVVIHGSDQIWRIQPEIHMYNPIYFGCNSIKSGKKVTYAASMGILPVSSSDNHLIKSYLSNLDSISVRESDLKTYVESMGYLCYQHIDPTLLLPKDFWIKIMNLQTQKGQKYVLYYHLMDNSFNMEMIKQFACDRGLELKIIYSRAMKKTTDSEITTADPKRFLELVYGAEFVFTSSFHGLVFSLLFQKQVFASFSKNSNRAASLLSLLGIRERLLKSMSNIPDKIPDIDYMEVSNRIIDLRISSLQYLKSL